MANWRKISLYSLGVVAVLGALDISCQAGYNAFRHNYVSKIAPDITNCIKMDGPLSHTSVLVFDRDRISMYRYSPLADRIYMDEDRDFKVDKIFERWPFSERSENWPYYNKKVFSRDEDLKSYPELFKNADRDFNVQIKRFHSDKLCLY